MMQLFLINFFEKMINQIVHINHSETKVFDLNNVNSRFYIGETINSLLKAIGNDCVLGWNDLSVKTCEYVNDKIIVTINPGICIIDNTQIEYPTENVIEFNPIGLDWEHGKIILSIAFKFLRIPNKNYSRIKLTYITNDGNVPDNSWYPEVDRVILAQIKFNNYLKTVDVQPNIILSPSIINVKGKDYVVYPIDSLSKRSLNYLNYKFN